MAPKSIVLTANNAASAKWKSKRYRKRGYIVTQYRTLTDGRIRLRLELK